MFKVFCGRAASRVIRGPFDTAPAKKIGNPYTPNQPTVILIYPIHPYIPRISAVEPYIFEIPLMILNILTLGQSPADSKSPIQPESLNA